MPYTGIAYFIADLPQNDIMLRELLFYKMLSIFLIQISLLLIYYKHNQCENLILNVYCINFVRRN